MNYAGECCSGVRGLLSTIVKHVREVCSENTVVDLIIDFASLPEQPSGFGYLQ